MEFQPSQLSTSTSKAHNKCLGFHIREKLTKIELETHRVCQSVELQITPVNGRLRRFLHIVDRLQIRPHEFGTFSELVCEVPSFHTL